MKSCSRKILELFYNAKHSGRITKPDAIGRVGENDDGLVIELTWRVADGVIADAKFRAFGNPNAIAITSLVTDNIINKPIEDAMQIDESILVENLDELRPEYVEAFDVVRMAMTEAYNNYLKRQNRKESGESVVDEVEIEPVQYFETDESEIEQSLVREIASLANSNVIGERRGRGRPRKERPEGEVEVVGEKRGRGRPRKVVDESEMVEVGEKRGRGRPRKEVGSTEVVEIGEKRGRGRPRKERPEVEEVVGEKRGRGRPRKERPEVDEVIGEKRGRGRPRKIVEESEIVEVGEKRGRGRPRKEVGPTEVAEIGEKRGRGRPRKLAVETLEIVDTEKRGRGRPRKEDVKIDLPTDLDEVINDEEVDLLINGTPSYKEEQNANFAEVDEVEVEDNITEESEQPFKANSTNFVNELMATNEDDMFDADYDIFKSNIRNILSGKDVRTVDEELDEKIVEDEVEIRDDDINKNIVLEDMTVKKGRGRPRKERPEGEVEEVGEKRGRGRPRKIVDESEVVEVGEKRGRGRPRKEHSEVEEVVEAEKRGRGRPRLTPAPAINSLTRSLTTNHNSMQDIVFASKNVTTTNININVTKTTTSIDEDSQSVSNDYSKNVNYSSVQENTMVSAPANSIGEDDEDEIEVETTNTNSLGETKLNKYAESADAVDDDFSDDFDEEIDDSHIKDEAPKGGIEDLLKALLNDD